MINIRLDEGFYLLTKPPVLQQSTILTKTILPTDHIVIIDCSGSMWDALSQIKQQIKNKLPMMMREDDTITVIWFSGKKQFGTIIEGVRLHNAADLPGIHRALDNCLKPISLTGFVDPLRESLAVIDRVNRPGRAVNLFFMSDGYDNCWTEKEILNIAEELENRVSSAAVVEYGYYCNSKLMTKIAEKLGATQILAENFPQYEPIFENSITKTIMGAKKIEVGVSQHIHDFAFTLDRINGIDITILGINNKHKVLVPEASREVLWFAELPPSANFIEGKSLVEHWIKTGDNIECMEALYASMIPLSQRMLSNNVFQILKVLGDVRLVEKFSNCFSKEDYNTFQDQVYEILKLDDYVTSETYNPNAVPADDAYTVLDLLNELSSDDGNLFYPNHHAFSYQRIGRKSVDVGSSLSESDTAELAEISNALLKIKDKKKLAIYQEKLRSILDNNTENLEFTPDNPDAGYPISGLVFNEDRPNVSAKIMIKGSIDLSSVIDEAPNKDLLPVNFPTHIWRNYTIIRDGIRNTKVLPVALTRDNINTIENHISINNGDHVYLLDLTELPLINRKMVSSVSADKLFQTQYELTKTKALQKVMNHYYDENFGNESSTRNLTEKYGADNAKWLGELGIKDYGYSPKTTLAESTDFYYGKELEVSIAGLSSLPTIKSVRDKLKDGKKLTLREELLASSLKIVDIFMDTVHRGSHGDAELEKHLLRTWLTSRKQAVTIQTRQLIHEMAVMKFSIIVGQTWPWKSLDENSLTMNFDGHDVLCTALLKTVEVKI